MPKAYGQTCPVAQSLEFLGERWTLLIVRDLLMGPRKFRDLSRSMAGVAPAVLSHRLKLLEANGIVSRRLYSEHPPRAEYTLTDRGRELRTVVRALGIWGSRHLGSAWTFVHDACGANVEIAYYCPACDKTVAADQVRRQPIPVRRRAGRRPVSKSLVAQRISATKRGSQG
jgi:DNA-binding HxlR family transcriptional regulator